ncbi:hypothetical protein [Streptomyces yaizuensis]|uniref:Uncharacterized protein n=1 Tax=Streptomyces yaizuensis TaxID=2989713 RepID=A0ABQ5P545_9ACTN|nr:hypothetical protein [Streptomyces sp. YSPA8]GLF97713.1 hypothetical protein SYYSPA8_25470 [Streptomyces sp. YSPA8]
MSSHQSGQTGTDPGPGRLTRPRAGDLTSFLNRRYPHQAAVEGLRERLAAVGPALPAASPGA